jgi:Protein of unknown function DUF262
VQKYVEGLEDDTNELFIPKYQRKFVWTISQRARFIESIMLGLPIPYMFAADSKENEGRLEIVDGSQRIRSLEAFLNGKLTLINLKKLTKLNDFRFSDLPISRQRRFRRQTLRLIAMTDKATRGIRKELFDRINTSSTRLTDMESRKGIYEGDFYYFLEQCANNELFKKLCPLPESRTERAEAEEMILRFFAHSERYQEFVHIVKDFLDVYMNDIQSEFTEETVINLRYKFEKMLKFVSQYFPYGFKKSPTFNSTPRVRFEAISVGVQLALEINPNLVPKNVSNWLESPEFEKHTTTHAANDKKKVIERIEYVKNKLLEK